MVHRLTWFVRSSAGQWARRLGVALLLIAVASAAADEPLVVAPETELPDLPQGITSFGAAVLGHEVYVYGGHLGRAHHYSIAGQSNALWRLDLKKPGQWETVATGPRLQGLAMVAHGNALYRLGGFTARNEEGEEHDLWSQAAVAKFDATGKRWVEVTPLPEPRSSFDAVVIGDRLYVAGGWALRGDQEEVWRTTAYFADLTQQPIRWERLPDPPFRRRALSLGAHQGRLFVIGGMTPKGPTTRVDVFDPETGKWTAGPKLPSDKAMEGFGSSAFALGNHLFVSTYSGKLFRLSADGTQWEPPTELKHARFFHRMLPLGERQLLLLGGASMTEGKFEELEVVTPAAKPANEEPQP